MKRKSNNYQKYKILVSRQILKRIYFLTFFYIYIKKGDGYILKINLFNTKALKIRYNNKIA